MADSKNKQTEQAQQQEKQQRKQIEEKQKQVEAKAYEAYVKSVTPTHSLGLQMLKAFITGGTICLLGQFILNQGLSRGLDDKTAASWCSLLLILLSVTLTGLNIYPRVVKWGGAGALVPITGFANSVAAPAIEFKAEGWVFGVGAKIFTIAGPVILYGVLASWVVGLIYWVCQMMK